MLTDYAVKERPTREPATTAPAGGWVTVCPLETLTSGRGVASLYHGAQVAVFLLATPSPQDDPELYAVGNLDPFSGANVISRGIVGSQGEIPTVASPMYKHRFDLRTGECLDDPSVRLPVYRVRTADGVVAVAAPH